MQWRVHTRPVHAQGRSSRIALVEDNSVVPLQYSDGDRLPRLLGESIADWSGAACDVQVCRHRACERDQPETQPVLLGRGVLLDQSPIPQRSEQSVGGGLVDPQYVSHLCNAGPPPAREKLHHGDGAVYRLHEIVPAFCGFHMHSLHLTLYSGLILVISVPVTRFHHFATTTVRGVLSST